MYPMANPEDGVKVALDWFIDPDQGHVRSVAREDRTNGMSASLRGQDTKSRALVIVESDQPEWSRSERSSGSRTA